MKIIFIGSDNVGLVNLGGDVLCLDTIIKRNLDMDASSPSLSTAFPGSFSC